MIIIELWQLIVDLLLSRTASHDEVSGGRYPSNIYIHKNRKKQPTYIATYLSRCISKQIYTFQQVALMPSPSGQPKDGSSLSAISTVFANMVSM